jgi:hypothetical protein
VRGHPAPWALSPLDCQVHLLVIAGDLPWGVLKARCGQVLLPPVPRRQQERSPGSAHRTCPTCALIARRPCSVPTDPWVPSPQTPDRQPAAAGHPNTVVRAIWVRRAGDENLHLLSARAVLDLAAMGCALACCSALLTTQDLAPRGWGTPCPTCLAAESAS